MGMNFAVIINADTGDACTSSANSFIFSDVCGKPCLSWAVSAAKSAEADEIIVITGTNEKETQALLGDDVTYVKSMDDIAEVSSYDFYVLLQADAPLVTSHDILLALDTEPQDSRVVSVPGTAAENIHVVDYASLAQVNLYMRQKINRAHMANGVVIMDATTTFIDEAVVLAPGAVIYPNVHLKGSTIIGAGTEITFGSLLENAVIGDNVSIKSSYIYDSSIGNATTVGPFAYIRPGSVIGEKCRIGDFVEIKNATIQNGSKVSHLTYVGDADVGSGVNFGCGTVTVNYDGAAKHRTIIGNNVFLGCNTNLVAPVVVEDGAYIAAGSTITDRVPHDTLAIARARQVIKENWKRPEKKK